MIMLRLPSYSTFDSVRMPEAATVPKRTMPAPPSTGDGIAATTPPMTGSRPSTTRMTPPAVTTNRDFTPVIATRPTFCANADCVNELNTGETAEESMSARRPFAMRFESTFVLTISPTAMMSAVVSAKVTMMTMNIEMIAAAEKVGMPNANGSGNAKMPRSRTFEKSAQPKIRQTTVPTTIAKRIDRREIIATGMRLSSRTTARVPTAMRMLRALP